MSNAAWFAFLVAAAIGAPARYLIDGLVQDYADGAFPWGTLIINVSGSFLIGLLAELFALRWDVSQATQVFLIVGLCGGYTTFSTYIVDVQQLLAASAARTALVYLVGTLLAALAGVYVGIIVTRWAVRRVHHHRVHHYREIR